MNDRTAMVAWAFFVAGLLISQPIWRQAEAVPMGPYQIAPQANSVNVWVVNTATGRLRICLPPVKVDAAPECRPWTQ